MKEREPKIQTLPLLYLQSIAARARLMNVDFATKRRHFLRAVFFDMAGKELGSLTS